jgi:hypothetical protein
LLYHLTLIKSVQILQLLLIKIIPYCTVDSIASPLYYCCTVDSIASPLYYCCSKDSIASPLYYCCTKDSIASPLYYCCTKDSIASPLNYCCTKDSIASPLYCCCRLLFKLRGPNFPLNLGLSAEERTALEATSLQDLMQSFHLRAAQGECATDFTM